MPDGVPSWQEMEALASGRVVPTVEEMTSGKPPKAKKPKPLCKYGPRGADGYCPKKPTKSTKSTAPTAGGSSSRPGSSGPPPLDINKLLGQVAKGAANQATKTAVQQIIPKIAPSKKERAKIIRGATDIGKVAVAKAAGSVAGLGAAIAALPAASVAAVTSAGIAAFLGTSYLKGLWENHMAARMLDKAKRNRNAQTLWDAAIAELERREKRLSTRDERLALHNLFFEEKKT